MSEMFNIGIYKDFILIKEEMEAFNLSIVGMTELNIKKIKVEKELSSLSRAVEN